MLAFACASANADITYYFGGTLSSAFGTQPAGTQFNGSFSYAYPQSPINSGIDQFGQFAEYILQNLNVTVGSQQLSWINRIGEARIQVLNNIFSGTDGVSRIDVDAFIIDNSEYRRSVGGESDFFGLLLLDESGRAFSSNALVNDSMRIDQFNYTEFTFDSSLGPTFNSNLTYLIIPEPSSLSLLALGGVVVALGRRKRA